MKKYLITIALVLVSIITFSGCSCSSGTTLSFNAVWSGGQYVGINETCEYSVKYLDTFTIGDNEYSKGTFEKVSIEYGDGSYETSLITVLISDLQSAGIQYSGTEQKFYRYKTSFSIPSKYTFTENSEVLEFTNTITSTVYFASHSNSLAPVYSIKNYDVVNYISDKAVRSCYSTEIAWGNDSAVLTKKSTEENAPNKDQYADSTNFSFATLTDKEVTKKYKYKQVIDNEELLLALRGVGLANDFTTTISVYDTAYENQIQKIAVQVVDSISIETNWNLNLNGNAKTFTETPIYKTLIGINNQKFGGMKTECCYQQIPSESDTTARGWLVKMVSPIISNAGIVGALEYSLKSVNVIQ